MKAFNWNEVEAQENNNSDLKRLVPGGYVCRIIDVKDVPEKEYLLVTMDVAEGEYANFAEKNEEATGNDWSYLRSYRSYAEKSKGYFKAFLNKLEKSNRGFVANKFDNNEQKLKGLLIGVVVREEEYVGKDKDGNDVLKKRCKPYFDLTVDDVRAGKFKTPALKELSAEDKARVQNNYVPFSNADVPVGDFESPF